MKQYDLLITYSDLLSHPTSLEEVDKKIIGEVKRLCFSDEDFRKLVLFLNKEKNKEVRDAMINMRFSKKKEKAPSKIAGYIDALMLGWFTGFFACITLWIMLYIISK